MFFCSHFSLTFSFFLGIVTNSSIIELNKKSRRPEGDVWTNCSIVEQMEVKECRNETSMNGSTAICPCRFS